MPDQEKEQSWVYHSDGSVEVIELEPYHCEFCNLDHRICIKLNASYNGENYFIVTFSLLLCTADFIKWGVDKLIISYSDWERHIVFNSTHERDLCYDVFINNPVNEQP